MDSYSLIYSVLVGGYWLIQCSLEYLIVSLSGTLCISLPALALFLMLSVYMLWSHICSLIDYERFDYLLIYIVRWVLIWVIWTPWRLFSICFVLFNALCMDLDTRTTRIWFVLWLDSVAWILMTTWLAFGLWTLYNHGQYNKSR